VIYDLHYLTGAATDALLSKITPKIRIIFVSYGDHEVCLSVYHEGELTTEEKLSFTSAAHLLKTYLPNDYTTCCVVKRVDPPLPIPRMGKAVYLRKDERSQRVGLDLSYLELASVRALFGLVTPSLRAVIVSLCEDRIAINSFFHGEITHQNQEDMSEMARRVKTNFPDHYSVSLQVKRLDAPEKIPWIGSSVYYRREWKSDRLGEVS
jgi:hypothetical protein